MKTAKEYLIDKSIPNDVIYDNHERTIPLDILMEEYSSLVNSELKEENEKLRKDKQFLAETMIEIRDNGASGFIQHAINGVLLMDSGNEKKDE